MNLRLPDIDWSVLRGAVAVSVGALIISLALLVGSQQFAQDMQRAYERDQRAFQRASRKYIALDDEERLIRTYLPRFEALKEKGILGQEQRLNWMEALRATKVTLRLPSLRYDIRPQETYQATQSARLGDFQIYASRMDLSAGLLHEEDLLRLIAELERRALGTFLIDSCSLSRVAERTVLDAQTPNVSARCQVVWLTLRQRSEASGRRR